MEFVKIWIKAVAAFALSILGSMATSLATQGTPVPQDGKQWLTFLITTVVLTAGVAIPRNKQTAKTVATAVQKDLDTVDKEQVANVALDALPDTVQANIVAYRAARP